MSLERINALLVSSQVVEQTEASLRAAGREGYELFVLWSGVVDGERFVVRTAHVPRQTSYRTEDGLLVRVEGEALHKLNCWLYENGERLAVQVHAHPTDAFHSDTDDAFPMVTTLGGFSIVLADFAGAGLLAASTRAFRLAAGGWLEAGPVKRLVEVT